MYVAYVSHNTEAIGRGLGWKYTFSYENRLLTHSQVSQYTQYDNLIQTAVLPINHDPRQNDVRNGGDENYVSNEHKHTISRYVTKSLAKKLKNARQKVCVH